MRGVLAGSYDPGGRYMPNSLFREHANLISAFQAKILQSFYKILNSFTIRSLSIEKFFYFLQSLSFGPRSGIAGALNLRFYSVLPS